MPPVNRQADLVKEAWDILVQAAAKEQTLYYGELAARLSRPANKLTPQDMTQFLTPIMLYCDSHRLPRLNDLVVGRQSKKPNYAPPGYDYGASHKRIFAFDWNAIAVSPSDFVT